MVSHKSSKLSAILKAHFGKSMNLARIKAMSMVILALCKVQQVTYTKLARAFDNKTDRSSCLRRIQRLMAECVLNTDSIARLILMLIPVKESYTLAMDRTNWKFNTTNINILTLGIVYDGMAFPILFKMLDKRGNSNTVERIELIQRFIDIAGSDSIANIMADREFVGCLWLHHLNDNHIHYHIRIRNNFWVKRHNRYSKAFWLFDNLRLGESKHLPVIYYVNDEACYLSGSKIMNKDGQPELQILVSYCEPEHTAEMYKQRWQIETLFKGVKSSGFNIENSHVRDLNRMSNLFAIIMIAYVWCYLIGDHIHRHIKPIKTLKHGRKAVSIFKYELDYVSQSLINHTDRYRIGLFIFSYT